MIKNDRSEIEFQKKVTTNVIVVIAESVDHLLLFCPIAHSLWMYMLRLFGIDWVMLGSVEDLLFCWFHWLGKHSSDIWDLVPGCNVDYLV